MFFTQEDYRKIEDYLKRKSIKDTEFNEAVTPLKGNEVITCVQDGHNVKFYIKDLIEQLFLLGVSDFLNVTNKYDSEYITLSEAISLIPHRSRKIGQVITFLNTEGEWNMYQFKGEKVNQWNNTNLWDNLLDFDKYIINSILPDEEDLTKTSPDENGNSYLKLKDKTYNPDEFSGLGRVYLRKNIVDYEDNLGNVTKKNILVQGMIDKENTIYIIQYDYDLNGKEITIPEGCMLNFQGGKINNGILSGNNSNVIAGFSQIFGLNVDFKGTWNINEVYPEWFGLTAYNKLLGKENVTAINKAIELQVLGAKKVVVKTTGDIYVDVKEYDNTWGAEFSTIKLQSNTNIDFKNCRLIVNENNYNGYYVLSAIGVSNVTVSGGVIIGDVAKHIGTTGEFGFGLYIAGSNNIYISNIEFNEFWGDGIILIFDSISDSNTSGIESEKHPRNIYIDNVKCLRNRRQGISICDGIDVFISNSSFNDTGIIKSTAPCSGIDLEPNGPWEYVKNVVCVNSEFKNNKGDFNATSWYNNSTGVTDDNLISATFNNCDFTSKTPSKINVTTADTIFNDCKIDEFWNATGTQNCGSYIVSDCELKRVVFNGTPQKRIIKNSTFKDYNGYIYWDALSIKNTYIIDCTFLVKDNSIVVPNWGNAVYSSNIILIQPKIINIGQNSSYAMEIHKIEVIRPILINCKLDIAASSPKIITDNYEAIIQNITNTKSLSNGTVASIGSIPWFIYDGKWYDAMGYTIGAKKGLNGERPMNLAEEDDGYLFYNKSYKSWAYWDGAEWKKVKSSEFYEDVGGGSTRPNSPKVGALYFDTDINMPIYWDGSKWLDSLGFKMENKKGLNGESPTNLEQSDAGYLFYNKSYKTWTYWDGTQWNRLGYENPIGLINMGESSNRPTKNIKIGFQYYDATLNKPIWWTGSKWVDATGAQV